MTPHTNTSFSRGLSNPFPIIDLKTQAVRLPISKGAQILLSELLTWSGARGYCWWSVSRIAGDLAWSPATVRRKALELRNARLLATLPRPGRSNYWIPLPGSAKVARIKTELTPLSCSRGPSEKKTNKSITFVPPSPPSSSTPNQRTSQQRPRFSSYKTDPNSQSTKPVASLTLDQQHLLHTIEQTCHDYHSTGHFINIVRHYHETQIYTALSATRQKAQSQSGVNAGAYFTATLRMISANSSNAATSFPSLVQPEKAQYGPATQTSHSSVQKSPNRFSVQKSSLPPHSTPQEFPPIEVDTDVLIKAWRLVYQPGDPSSVMAMIARCLPDWDVQTRWYDLKKDRPGELEQNVLDEFLELAAFKMKCSASSSRTDPSRTGLCNHIDHHGVLDSEAHPNETLEVQTAS